MTKQEQTKKLIKEYYETASKQDDYFEGEFYRWKAKRLQEALRGKSK